MLEWVWFCDNQTHSPLTSFDLEFGCRVPEGRSQVRDPFCIELEFTGSTCVVIGVFRAEAPLPLVVISCKDF